MLTTFQQLRLVIKLHRFRTEISQAMKIQYIISALNVSCFIAWILLILYLQVYCQNNTLSDYALGIITCITPFLGFIGARQYKKINNRLETLQEKESEAILAYSRQEARPALPTELEALERICQEAQEWTTKNSQTLIINKLIGGIMEAVFIILQTITVLLICFEIKEPFYSIMLLIGVIPLVLILIIILHVQL